MRILQLCLRVPFPPRDGGSIAMASLAGSLRKSGASIKILAFNTSKHPVDIARLEPSLVKDYGLEAIYIDNKVRWLPALIDLLTGQSYNLSRFIRRDFDEKLREVLEAETFDVVQLESLYMMPYLNTIRSASKAKVVLRTHNVEYLIWERMAAGTKNPLRRSYIAQLARRLKRYESFALRAADAILAITPEDASLMRKMGAVNTPVHLTPVGLHFADYVAAPLPANWVVFHLGAMDWLPNQEAVDFLIESIYPLAQREFSDTLFHLAGRGMPEHFLAKSTANLRMSGEVASTHDFINTGSVLMVPLRSGSGMRVKIVEAMAMGRPVISTRVGMEGIPAIDGTHFLLAETADDFLKAYARLRREPGFAQQLSQNAQQWAKDYFDADSIGRSTLSFYENLIRDKKS